MHRLSTLLVCSLLLSCHKPATKPKPTVMIAATPAVPPSTYNTGDALYPPDVGYYDVKAKYGCKGDGQADDTACIKRAMNDAMRGPVGGRYGTVYFPEGTYLISDELLWGTFGNGNATVDYGVDTTKGCITGLRITNQGSGYGASSSSNYSNPGPAIFFRGGGGYGPSIIGRRTSAGGIDSFYAGLGNVGSMSCLGKGYKSKPSYTVVNWKAYLRFEGQNKSKTIIRLTDNNPKYQNANCKVSLYGDPDALEQCRSMLYTSNEMAANGNGVGESAYIDDVWNLTLSTGSGNPGAIALDWIGSNRASVKNVDIRSEDGKAKCGLNVSRSSSAGPGPAYVKNVSISGFEYGIYSVLAAHEVGTTFEFIDLSNITKAGVVNSAGPNWFRAVSAWAMTVPIFLNKGDGGSLLVVDGNFATDSGEPEPPIPPEPPECPCAPKVTHYAAINAYAIQNTATHGVMFLRNIQTSGFAGALQGGSGNAIDEYSYPQQTSDSRKSLNMTDIPDTPAHWKYPAINPELWTRANCTVNNVGSDSTACIQACLDSTKDICYLPFGEYRISKTLRLTNPNLRVFYGAGSVITNNPSRQFCTVSVEGAGDTNVEVRNLNFRQSTQSNSICINSNRSSVTVANTLGGVGLTVTGGTATIFLEDVAMPNGIFTLSADQRMYARQYDVESGTGLHVRSTGGVIWTLGFKTEGAGLLWDMSGGQHEILGSFSSSAGGPSPNPAYKLSNMQMSAHGMTLRPNGWKVGVQEDGQNTAPNTAWVGSGNGSGALRSKKAQ